MPDFETNREIGIGGEKGTRTMQVPSYSFVLKPEPDTKKKNEGNLKEKKIPSPQHTKRQRRQGKKKEGKQKTQRKGGPNPTNQKRMRMLCKA
jgi:hypothetical protein